MTDTFDEGEENKSGTHNRKLKTGAFWAVICVGSVWLQPYLNLDIGLVEKLLDKSTWIAGLIIAGIAGVNALHAKK